jgi:hypothetical protein
MSVSKIYVVKLGDDSLGYDRSICYSEKLSDCPKRYDHKDKENENEIAS